MTYINLYCSINCQKNFENKQVTIIAWEGIELRHTDIFRVMFHKIFTTTSDHQQSIMGLFTHISEIKNII